MNNWGWGSREGNYVIKTVDSKQEISSRPSSSWALAVRTKAVNDVILPTSTGYREFRPSCFHSFHILQVFPLTFDDVEKKVFLT